MAEQRDSYSGVQSRMTRLLEMLSRARVFDLWHALQPNRLTVLNYHRIGDPDRTDFDLFKPNISATPQDFACQMDYIAENFNPISIGDLTAWLGGGAALPGAQAPRSLGGEGPQEPPGIARPQLAQRTVAQLPYPLAGHPQQLADLLQGMLFLAL